jgi:drug/metabolite transporter (DMT)-like permease
VTNPTPAQSDAGHADVGARLMLVLLCVIWGITWPVMRIALYEIPPLSMRTVTAALGAMTLYAVCRFQGRSLRIARARDWLHVTVVSLLSIVAFTVLGSFAQLTATTSRVTILAYTMPIWATLLAWPLLGERPSRAQSFALVLCVAGLAILIYPLAATKIQPGIWLALLTGVSWAGGTVYLKWAQIKADPMGVASWQVTIAFLVTGVFMLTFEGGLHFAAADTKALLATASTGFLANGVAYGLWFTIVRRLPAAMASLGVLGSPVIGVIASMLILGERPTAPDIIGFALIFAASACVLLARPAPAVAPVAAQVTTEVTSHIGGA